MAQRSAWRREEMRKSEVALRTQTERHEKELGKGQKEQ